MPQSTSFLEHPIATLEEALDLRKQIETLQRKLSNILGNSSSSPAPKAVTNGRRKMSPATIAKMRAAQQARWAAKKGKTVEAKAPKTSAKAAAKAPKRKGGLTEEGRAKLAAAMKARWAARKKGAPAPNAAAK